MTNTRKKTTKFRRQWTIVPNLSYTKCEICETAVYYRHDSKEPKFCSGCGARIIATKKRGGTK